jgi:peptide/nickel transport system substrate-binding protein
MTATTWHSLPALPLAILAVLVVLIACTPAGQRPAAQDSTGASQGAGERRTSGAASTRTVVLANRSEPDSLSEKALARVAGGGEREVPRLFTAALAIDDDQGMPRPYLAEGLPQLNSDSWRVSPDGRMETTYRLRPNLTWHDGAALTAPDFAFAAQVYATPEFGLAASPPMNQLEEVLAPDERTVVLRWSRPFPDAAGLIGLDFPPLPRHLLEAEFQSLPAIAFASHPFWTTGYVGSGPYRIDRWEPGAFLEGAAFDGHATGRARIDRVQVRFMPDSNAVLASLLSGDVHLAIRSSIEVPQGVVLRRDWSARNAGTVMMIPSFWRRAEVQHRPDFVSPAALLDVRVRKALAHAIDRQAQNEGVFEGEAIVAYSMIPPSMPYFADAERVIAKYPYDVRRTEALMNEAGWQRGADGVYAHPASGRFTLELKVNASIEGGTELSITGDGLRQAGIDAREVAVPRAQQRDGEVRGGFPGLYLAGGGIGEKDTLPNLVSGTIPRPENRWVGNNRSGWANAEYDRLFEQFTSTLARPERDRQVVQMARIYTEDVGNVALMFYPAVVASAAALRGPAMHVGTNTVVWNVHEWEWTRG